MAEVHGNRTPAQIPGETADSGESGANSGAVGAQEAPLDPDLTLVVSSWPTLPEAIKAGILAMIRTTSLGP
jgi:hypothetical protein